MKRFNQFTEALAKLRERSQSDPALSSIEWLVDRDKLDAIDEAYQDGERPWFIARFKTASSDPGDDLAWHNIRTGEITITRLLDGEWVDVYGPIQEWLIQIMTGVRRPQTLLHLP